ncbi:MAG: 4'-phosphopantetheinyl transferase superfamily protein [Chloroflexi bacterium]|nr:4'-phosphopantetheinyl transferase superfamily protein [Chloroflexota bacterium]MCY4110804.1 4'-phosphopantetheinyl transferase superfamily protein [Chloroflexota bacterium]
MAFEESQHGKPFATVDGMPVPDSFNVSHSGGHGLIAFAPAGRLGVDIEERVAHRNLDLLVETVLGEQEQALLARTRGDARTHLFFKLWTMKEALIKAHGMGMALDPSRVHIPTAMLGGTTQSTLQSPEMPGVRWRLDDLGNEQFAAAVAHELRAAPEQGRGNGCTLGTPANA